MASVADKIISAEYKLIPYHQWEKMNYIGEYQKSKKKMLNMINDISQAEAKELGDMLNDILRQISTTTNEDGTTLYDELMPKLGSKLEEIKSKFENTNTEIKYEENFQINNAALSEAWREYFIAKNKYDNETDMSKQPTEGEVKALKSKALSMQANFSRAKGALFEAFLQMVIPVAENMLGNVTSENTKDLLATLDNNLGQSDKIETQGSKHDDTITVSINDKEWSISSQGKVDVHIEKPFNHKNLDISAKNYASLSNISLLSGASISHLVSEWPGISNKAKNYFINGLTVWKTPADLFTIGKTLFAIQGLAGSRAESYHANVLIINVRNNKTNPIRVISIPSLLKRILSEDIDPDKAFNFKFSEQIPMYDNGVVRDSESFEEKLRAARLNIKLKKDYIKLSYLKNLL